MRQCLAQGTRATAGPGLRLVTLPVTLANGSAQSYASNTAICLGVGWQTYRQFPMIRHRVVGILEGASIFLRVANRT